MTDAPPSSSIARRRATVADFVERAFVVLGEVDYYQILGLGRDATDDAIRAAYYKLATRLHPDVHGDELEPEFRRKLTAVFSRAVEAYRVLTDGARRLEYDAGLADGEVRMAAGVKVKAKPEESIQDANARKFYTLGAQALGGGDTKAAVMNLRVAFSLERSPVIKEALDRAEAAHVGGGSGGVKPVGGGTRPRR
jgi:DnaJ-class molecular chaperone